MKTLQDAANKIARHLLKQKARSHDGNTCRYRIISDSGRLVNRCAIGCLIEKKYYEHAFENKGIWRDMIRGAIKESGYDVSGSALDFYDSAQKIHDGDWDNRNAAFKQLCANYNLEYNPS